MAENTTGAGTTPSRRSSGIDDTLATLLGFIFVLAFPIFGALGQPGVLDFLKKWWWLILALLIGVAFIVALVFALPAGRTWLNKSSASTRAAVLSFGVLPILLFVICLVILWPRQVQLTALRVVFLVLVCILPASMWPLFLAARKASLLNEFLANLYRLGLLQSVRGENVPDMERRVRSYLQRFEAIYGALQQNVHEDVLKGNQSDYSREDTGGASLPAMGVPVVISTLLVALGWLTALPPGDVDSAVNSAWVHAFEPENNPVTLAFLGAYFFSLQMLFRRYVLHDLRGSAYVSISVRIILAVIGIWVLTAVKEKAELGKETLMAAGFVIGVFPRVVWQFMQSVFKRAAGWFLPSFVAKLPLNGLDGLTVWHEARLEEEDIENIPNMATADLVELLLNTRLPPERIVYWTDQAILYTALGTKEDGAKSGGSSVREKLSERGIRTATSLINASSTIATQDIASDIINGLDAVLRANSNLQLVQNWHANSPSEHSGRDSYIPEPREPATEASMAGIGISIDKPIEPASRS
jgi:hypothetical protein